MRLCGKVKESQISEIENRRRDHLPLPKGACGALKIDPKENSLWKEISKLSSNSNIGSEGEKGFLADQK